MKLKFILLIIVVVISALNGCELVTDKNAVAPPPQGDDLILNEVFTLSPDRSDTYSWIELYNPTDHKITWFSQEFPAIGCAVGPGGMITKTRLSKKKWENFNS